MKPALSVFRARYSRNYRHYFADAVWYGLWGASMTVWRQTPPGFVIFGDLSQDEE